MFSGLVLIAKTTTPSIQILEVYNKIIIVMHQNSYRICIYTLSEKYAELKDIILLAKYEFNR